MSGRAAVGDLSVSSTKERNEITANLHATRLTAFSSGDATLYHEKHDEESSFVSMQVVV